MQDHNEGCLDCIGKYLIILLAIAFLLALTFRASHNDREHDARLDRLERTLHLEPFATEQPFSLKDSWPEGDQWEHPEK